MKYENELVLREDSISYIKSKNKPLCTFIIVLIVVLVFTIFPVISILIEIKNQVILEKLNIFELLKKIFFGSIFIIGILPLTASLPELYKSVINGYAVLFDKREDLVKINGIKECKLSKVKRAHIRILHAIKGDDIYILYLILNNQKRILVDKSEDFNEIYKFSKVISEFIKVPMTKN
ncbi:hypothetical protein RBH29_08110 [Herbivorax sp. ANBcel31]|uniref:hypothetical protein n=1 Tax=Herbivorax sp. ANBcel31 TaxID=3069754 RepID=UPI0027B747F1|nr:hypothetical protein [Herbivorax sp. ANBcel31]MDQ2086392.1 hypothetical protein [Herbivorax sp. ANBcel31]